LRAASAAAARRLRRADLAQRRRGSGVGGRRLPATWGARAQRGARRARDRLRSAANPTPPAWPHRPAQGFFGDDQLASALTGCDLVIIPAGVPRKPGMTRDDLFKINAGIVKGLMTAVGKHCPGAWVNMISNPVNSTVPIAAETLKAMGVYDPKRLFGVTTLDVVRAHTFYAEKKGLDVGTVDVPVVGGHAGITILPLLSKATPTVSLTDEEVDALTKRTQDGGTEVVAAKAGKGSATLSMAYAGSLFGDACLRAMNGEKDVYQYTYVASSVQPGVSFFASKVLLGKSGAEKVFPLPDGLTPYEQAGVKAMIPELKSSIDKGIDFVKNN
jgi:malate dehydrogenase